MTPGAGPAMRFEARYAAFVIGPGSAQPARVELGPAGPIDEAVMSWLERIERGGDVDAPARQLARLLWAPLAPHIGDARQVMISPDGALNFLPWGGAARQIPRHLLAGRPCLRAGGGGQGAHAESPRAKSAGQTKLARGRRRRLRAGRRRLWCRSGSGGRRPALCAGGGQGPEARALPGTLVEAKAIINIFGEHGAADESILLISGPQATKDRVRSSLAGRRYLHLATHGYFAAPEFASALVPEDSGTPLHSLDGMDRSEVRGLYPGLLSGLVFAGANRPPRDTVTGLVDFGSAVMTAEEIAGLDLSACDLAVLSACETGRGSVAGGEGVLGLQARFIRRVLAP